MSSTNCETAKGEATNSASQQISSTSIIATPLTHKSSDGE